MKAMFLCMNYNWYFKKIVTFSVPYLSKCPGYNSTCVLHHVKSSGFKLLIFKEEVIFSYAIFFIISLKHCCLMSISN